MAIVEIEKASPAERVRAINSVKLPGSLTLVLPAHNEEANIRIVVEQALDVLPAFTSEFEIIVVNDGSKDKTGEIIDELAATNSHVRAVHHKKNRGYGGA